MDRRIHDLDARRAPSVLPPWRLLVVDDDPDVHALMELMIGLDDRFAMGGSAHNGLAALALAERNQPDAVILDLSMPDLDGWAALPRLRALLPDAGIIVFSAYPDPISLLQILSAGGDGYINKATSWELMPVLAEVMRDRRHLPEFLAV
jgi:CheY-like chemotaxis protein